MPNTTIDIPIFIIKQLKKDKTKTICVFYGKEYHSSTTQEERLSKVFSKKERDEIRRENIPVHFSQQAIYLDDTIKTVKQKIILEWIKEATTDELYLFYQTHVTLHPEVLYKRLAKRSVLSASTLETFFSNIPSLQLNIPKKPTLEDLLEMKLESTPYLSDMLLGGDCGISPEPFTYNPFRSNDHVESNVERQILEANSKLILNCGEIINNTLYVCLAEDVPDEAFPLYYPALKDKKIYKKEDIPSQRNTNQAARLAQEKIKKSFEWVNLFYDIYRERKADLQYIQSGVKYIQFAMNPVLDVNFPLERMFKIIHATQQTPLIKYNPSTKEEYPRQENMYRLYANTLSTNGRKIPYLNKAVINRQINAIGRSKSLSMYLDTRNESIQTLTCEITSNGTVTITADFVQAQELPQIDELLKKYLNDVLTGIQHFLEERGNMFSLFTHLNDENIDIKNIIYQTDIQLKKKFDLEPYKNCISSVFINETNRLKNAKQVNLRLKRVEYYSAHTSQEAFILDKVNQKMSYGEIVHQLVENYSKDGLDKDTATELVKNTLNDLEVIQGARKSDIKIKDNPGFKTTILLNLSAGFITVTVENINHTKYLQTVPVYLDTLVRLTQNVESTYVPLKDVQELCSEKYEEEEEEEEEQKSASPASQKNTFQMFYGDDEEENEDEDAENAGEDAVDEEGNPVIKSKGTLHLLYDDDDEDEDEEEEEDEDEKNNDDDDDDDEKYGGKKNDDDDDNNDNNDDDEDDKDNNDDEDDGNNDDNEDDEEDDTFRNIDGMKLNKPYYFQKLIEKKDPSLIIKEDNKGKFNSYVRTCSSTERKQPVILTDAQLDKIKKQHPGFLRDEDVVRYGSTPKKQFNYICPRYWCLKTNTIVDPAELKEVVGKNGVKELEHPTCGKVLPQNEKDVKPGYYIYDFGSSKYPGLIPDKHPDGYCLPCCFKYIHTKGRMNAMKQCLNNNNATATAATPVIPPPEKDDEYIKQHDKFPLDKGRWGYLPIELQMMFREKSIQCQNSKKNIKDNYPCILRHGVERSDTQSFVACFADVLYFGTSTPVPSIDKMKTQIIHNLTLEKFVTYQNGNLVTDFYTTKTTTTTATKDMSKYEKSPLFSKERRFDTKEDRAAYMHRIVNAYENFIAFLKDDSSLIDHTYLWDLVCSPDTAYSPKGFNMVIFEIPDDDITNNVQIICPTNQYSKYSYDTRRPTIFLVKRNGLYEPIYSYVIAKKTITATTKFDELNPQLSPAIRDVLNKIIKPFFRFVCQPRASLPAIYKAKRAILLETLLQLLAEYRYTVLQFVSNYHNKIIGVVAHEPENKKKVGFIPCYPSSKEDPHANVVMMTDFDVWQPYSSTFAFLKKLAHTSKNVIPCEPAFKVMEDEHAVGMLTETNQFVQISAPLRVDDIPPHQTLPTLQNANYIVDKNKQPMKQVDVEIMTTSSTAADNERVEYVNKIRLDSQYYNAFRNTIRILMNQYKNNKIRKRLELVVQNILLSYSNKLKIVEEFLHTLVGNQIQFTGDAEYYKKTKNVTSCVTMVGTNNCMIGDTCHQDKGKGNQDQDQGCYLVLPRKNLITHKENEKMYYGKMADQLIRYPMIYSFVFKPQNYVYFGDIGYDVNDDEIIMLQSLITQDYFESLVPMKTNQYASQKSYDEVEPLLSQPYNSHTEIVGDGDDALDTWRNCQRKERTISSNVWWKKCFPADFQETYYTDQSHCTPFLLQELIKIHAKKKISIHELKKELFQEYNKYTENHLEKIAQVFIREGKRGRELLSGEWPLSAYLFSEDYTFDLLDAWLLVQRYQLPTIFLSNQENTSFVGYGGKTDSFAFLSLNEMSVLSVISSPQKEMFFPMDTLNETGRTLLRNALIHPTSVEKYLSQEEIAEDFPKSSPVPVPVAEAAAAALTRKNTPEKKSKTKKICVKGKEINVKTGRCVMKKEEPVVPKKITRCPKGTRKNRKTGKCEPVA